MPSLLPIPNISTVYLEHPSFQLFSLKSYASLVSNIKIITLRRLPYSNHKQAIVMRIFVIFAIFSTAVMGLPNPSPNHHPKNTNPFPKPKAPLAPVCDDGRARYTCGGCVMNRRSCEQHTHCDRQGLLAVSSAPPGCQHEDVEEFCMLVDPSNNPQCRCVRGA